MCATVLLCSAALIAHVAYGQPSRDSANADTITSVSLFTSRVSVGIAFGINGVSAQDIISLINQENGVGTVTANSFGSAAAFSSSFTYRFADAFDASLSQAYITKSYQIGDVYSGITYYSYDLNEYALFLHRVFPEDTYSIAIGLGGGVLYGVYRRAHSDNPGSSRSTATGGVFAVELIFRSAFGGHLFLHTELRGGVTFSGDIHDANGRAMDVYSPPQHRAEFSTTLGGFGIGLDYCF